jgi:hypothetical protein
MPAQHVATLLSVMRMGALRQELTYRLVHSSFVTALVVVLNKNGSSRRGNNLGSIM